MKSWKTTVAGAIAAVGTYLVANETGIAHVIGQILVGAGPFLLGLFARDNNVTSEAAGAKKPE